MLDCTDRHARYFLRLISRHAVLYTEMITTGALLHGDPDRLLAFDPAEHPVAAQLGGSDPVDMAACSRLVANAGYDEININVGCPSDRVQSGRFGACLMLEPETVARCVAAMREATPLPVTVKTRLGVDHHDNYTALAEFTSRVASAGCRTLIVHARKAWLQGLSPKQNREIPPLDYDRVIRLKRDFPDLEIIINGGISELDMATELLRDVDGVMVGREAYHNPWLLAEVDRRIYGDPHAPPDRHQVIERLLPYIAEQLGRGTPLHRITRHILGLFQGRPGARAWRRYLSEHAHREGAGVDVIRAASRRVPLETA
jgi:tRNA-dihydrouridine synthase A